MKKQVQSEPTVCATVLSTAGCVWKGGGVYARGGRGPAGSSPGQKIAIPSLLVMSPSLFPMAGTLPVGGAGAHPICPASGGGTMK